jgi:hypothetical protein
MQVELSQHNMFIKLVSECPPVMTYMKINIFYKKINIITQPLKKKNLQNK